MDTFESLESYLGASVIIDGTTRYEVRHYGSTDVHRFTENVSEGDGVFGVREYPDGPITADLPSFMSLGRLREILWTWVLDEEVPNEHFDLWRRFDTDAHDAFCRMLAEWLATAGASVHQLATHVASYLKVHYDLKDGEPWVFNSDATRHAASIMWNIADRPCDSCGSTHSELDDADEVIEFRVPVYVYGSDPLCATCARWARGTYDAEQFDRHTDPR